MVSAAEKCEKKKIKSLGLSMVAAVHGLRYNSHRPWRGSRKALISVTDYREQVAVCHRGVPSAAVAAGGRRSVAGPSRCT